MSFSQCSLDQIANTLLGAQCLVPVDNNPTEPASTCDFAINFSNGANEFEFVDDPQDPAYSSPSTLGGAISTTLGGVDNSISNIEGAWSRQCVSAKSDNLTFAIEASLSQSPDYEANEISQIALRVNGVTSVLDTINGDGNGGAEPTTGTQQYSVNVPLNTGTNTIELVCLNNLKTFENESTQCQFISLITGEPVEESDDALCFPVRASNSRVSVVCL